MDELYIETARRQLRVIWGEDPGIQLVQRAPLVHPIERRANINEKGEILQEIFFKFLKDATSKVVRGTAY